MTVKRCFWCDGEMDRAATSDTCQACRRKQAHERREWMAARWREGIISSKLAEELGWTKNYLSVELHHARKLGYDLPYRRATRQR